MTETPSSLSNISFNLIKNQEQEVIWVTSSVQVWEYPTRVPYLTHSSFNPHWAIPNGHMQTISGSLMDSSLKSPDLSEKVSTPDQDFVSLDWYFPHENKLMNNVAILCHGLESDARAIYIKRLANHLLRVGWTVAAWTYRGCGKQMNNSFRLYHSGASEDLHTIVSHIMQKKVWKGCGIIGFSLGGNITLKYAGERDWNFKTPLIGSIGISVPCHLSSSSRTLARPHNKFYMDRFFKSLEAKIIQKEKQFPGSLDLSHLGTMSSFHEFDEHYTARIHGFTSAEDYYSKSSSLYYLPKIRTRALLINALDDPFLSQQCYPKNIAQESDHFYLETPENGGHMGFISGKWKPQFWINQRISQFLSEFDL